MSKDDWVAVGEYQNASSAQIASALLTTMKVPHKIWPTTRPVVGMSSSGNYNIWVAPGLAEEAKNVLSESAISEAELTAQALAEPPPDDA
jgi:hypothetical protein